MYLLILINILITWRSTREHPDIIESIIRSIKEKKIRREYRIKPNVVGVNF